MTHVVDNTKVVCAETKVAVEIKAETLADSGYTMIGAPYFEELRQVWCYRVQRPDHLQLRGN